MPGQVGDAGGPVADPEPSRVVVNDDDAVAGRVDVELDGVCPPLERPLEGGKGVFAEAPAWRPSMGDSFHGAWLRPLSDVYCRQRRPVGRPADLQAQRTSTLTAQSP